MIKIRIILLIYSTVFLFACNESNSSKEVTVESKAIASGEQLFKIDCAQCHRPAEEFIGPGLKNVATRWKNKALLYEFIREPQAVIAKDPYAKALFVQWKQAYMQPFPNLSDKDIDHILSYCETAQ